MTSPKSRRVDLSEEEAYLAGERQEVEEVRPSTSRLKNRIYGPNIVHVTVVDRLDQIMLNLVQPPLHSRRHRAGVGWMSCHMSRCDKATLVLYRTFHEV